MKLSFLIAQFPISLDIQCNLQNMQAILQGTQPGDLALFPEGCLSGYSHDLSFLDAINKGELLTGLEELGEIALQRKIHLWAGVCIPQDGQWFNAAYGFTPGGETHIYHKINLANHERGILTPGDQLPIFHLQTPVGSLPVAIQICRELRYPEQWGWLARQGAKVFLHLNNAVEDDRFQPVWRSHLVSRAAETQRFVLSANNAASKQGSPTVAIAPSGHILQEIVSDEVKYMRIQVDISQVSDWYLDQRRSDIVSISKTKTN
jgi:predicted amidohydrolase